jgi:DNA-binding LytR/AlgR family response regulator
MNVIIVEDERLSADHLSLLLSKIDPTIQVLHHFESVKQCVKAFTNGISADLIFLDIHLADGNSFEIFSKVAIDTPIIFTTAYDQYAIQAFQVIILKLLMILTTRF